MREKFSQERHDDEVGRLIQEGLSRAVAREEPRLLRMERTVMHEIERRRQRSRFGWLSFPSFKPAWALAAAATVFLVGFFLGSWTTNPLNAQGVEFVVFKPEAQEVTLAINYPVTGYNEWQDIPLKERGGLWYISLRLPPGTYEYGFKIDGEWWAYDPAAKYLVRSVNNTVNAVREVKNPGDQT